MRMHVWVVVLLFGFSGGGVIAHTETQDQPSPMPTGRMSMGSPNVTAQTPAPMTALPMSITFGDKSETWTPSSLAALPHKTVTVYNEHKKANQTYSGVPLIDLLVRLGVPAKPHGKELRHYLVARGADGYEAVYSVAEVNPDVHDATVIVADSLDGKPIASNGPFQLVATREKHPARWVWSLIAIQVLTAE